MENLQITIDLETAAAISNAIALAQQLRALREEVSGLGEAVGGTDQKLGRLASASQQAAPSVQALSRQAQGATNNFQQYNQQINVAVQATQNLNTTNNTAVTNITNVTNATKQATEATSSLVSQVTSLVGAYFGLRGVITMIRELIENLAQMKRAQNELTDKAIDFDVRAQSTMANLDLHGAQGQAHATKLIREIVSRARVSPERAADALEVTHASGIPVGQGQETGLAFASELASFAERRKFDKESVLQFSRTLVQRGITDVGGLKVAESKFDAQFVQSLETDPTMFMRGLVGVLSSETPKDVNPDYAASLYTAMVAQSRNTLRAQMSTKAVFDLAGQSSNKTGAFFAHQAAQMGVTSVTPVSDADLEQAIGSRGQDMTPKEMREARQVFDAQRHLELRKEKLLDDDRKFRDETHSRRFLRMSAEERQRTVGEHDRQLRSEQEQIEQDSRKIQDQRDDLRGKETSFREIEAYRKLGTEDRVRRVILPAAGRSMGSAEGRNAFVEGTGGLIARDDAVFLISTPQSQKIITSMQAASAARTAREADSARNAFGGERAGQLAEIDAQRFLAEHGAVGPGQVEDRLRDQQAATQQRLDAARGRFTPTIGKVLAHPLTFLYDLSEARQVQQEKEAMLERDLRAYRSGLTSGSQEANEIDALIGQLDAGKSSMTNITDVAAARLSSIAQAFGSIKASTAARKNMPATRPAAPTTRPTTRPTTQPSVGAQSVNYHYNTIHIGNHWSGGDDDFDLPGRLEGYS